VTFSWFFDLMHNKCDVTLTGGWESLLWRIVSEVC